MKKNLAVGCVLVFSLATLLAIDMTATMQNGQLVILHDNGTYEIVVADMPTISQGYAISESPVSFVDIIWNNFQLIKMGNYLPSQSYGEKDKYTLGDFYMLSVEVTNPDELPLEFDLWSLTKDWQEPVIKGSDHKTYAEMSSMFYYLSDELPYIGSMWDQPLATGQSRIYYQIFELPKDVVPIEVGVSSIYKKNIKWIPWGNEIQFK